jgi:hypothetical protein
MRSLAMIDRVILVLIALSNCAATCDDGVVNIGPVARCDYERTSYDNHHDNNSQINDPVIPDQERVRRKRNPPPPPPFKTKHENAQCQTSKLMGLLKNPRRLSPRLVTNPANIRDLHLRFGWGVVITKNKRDLQRYEYQYRSSSRISGATLCRKWKDCPIGERYENQKFHVSFGVANHCAKQVCTEYLRKYYDNDINMYRDDKPSGVFEFCKSSLR